MMKVKRCLEGTHLTELISRASRALGQQGLHVILKGATMGQINRIIIATIGIEAAAAATVDVVATIRIHLHSWSHVIVVVAVAVYVAITAVVVVEIVIGWAI